MKRSKMLSVTAIILAMVFTLSACGNKANNSANTSTTGNNTASSDKAIAESTSEPVTDLAANSKNYDKKLTISWAGIQIADGVDYNHGNEFLSWWADTYNIEWDITALTFENWAERLRIWINADDMPDMAVWNYVHGEAVNYADQGLVKKLPDDWTDKYPNLARAAGNTVMNQLVADTVGGTYFLFRPVYALNRPSPKLSTHISAYLRQDWADEIGFELKDVMTVSEIVEFAKQLKANDPGKVAEKYGSFYPIAERSSMLSYLVQFDSTYSGVGGTPYYLGDDGTYKWGPADQDTLKGLQSFSQLYKEGLLHPEFYTLKDPDDYGMFYTTGQTGILIAEGMAAWMTRFHTNFKDNMQLDFEKVVRPVVIVGDDRNYHGSVVTNFWATNIFSPHITDEKLARVLDMIDYSCTDEGQAFIRMGFEGVDWKEENGEYINLHGEGEDVSSMYNIFPVYGNMFILSDDFQFLNPSYLPQYRAKAKEMFVLRDQNSTDKTLPMNPDFNVMFHSSQSLNLASMVYTDEYANIVIADGDIATNWNAWVQEKMALIQPVLDELNANK